jgi:hypothetical protein
MPNKGIWKNPNLREIARKEIERLRQLNIDKGSGPSNEYDPAVEYPPDEKREKKNGK